MSDDEDEDVFFTFNAPVSEGEEIYQDLKGMSALKSSMRKEFEDVAEKTKWGDVFNHAPLQDQVEEEGEVLWLITFTDIMALMLTFFVLLYSMSQPQMDKWSELADELSKGVTYNKSLSRFSGESAEISIDKISTTRALDLNYLASLLSKDVESDEKLKAVLLFQGKDSLIISLPTDLLFSAGKADISTDGSRAIHALSNVLTKIRNRIEVIGHADPRSVNGSQYASNWELSLARATAVARVLAATGYQRDIIPRGLSSARYDEITGDLGESTRMDLARRVDIVIMKDDGSQRIMLDFAVSG